MARGAGEGGIVTSNDSSIGNVSPSPFEKLNYGESAK